MKYSTQFGQTMPVGVLQNLSDESFMHRFEHLLLEKSARIPFKDGLSPIFPLLFVGMKVLRERDIPSENFSDT